MSFVDPDVERMCADPMRAQRSALREILGANARSEACRSRGLSAKSSIDDLRSSVVIARYDRFRPLVERMRRGESDVLTEASIVLYAKTSGTSAEPKVVPVTRAAVRAQSAAEELFLRAAIHDVPAAGHGDIHFVTSPREEGSISSLARARAGSFHGRFVARPTPATTLLGAASPRTLADLLAGRSWPRLAMLACWKRGPSALHLADLERRSPGAAIRDIGLVSSEGYFAVPLDASGGAVPMASHHFFELVDVRDETVRTLVEAEDGRRYRLVVTTPGGLYRYDTEDVVEVIGFRAKMPLLAFCHRAGAVVSLVGEKVTEAHVVEAVQRAAGRLSIAFTDFVAELDVSAKAYRFAVVCDEAGSPGGAGDVARAIDDALAEVNCEYERRRKMQRLSDVRVDLVDAGQLAALRSSRRGAGGRRAHFKLVHLRLPGEGD